MRNFWMAMALAAVFSSVAIAADKDSFVAKSKYLQAEISLLRPQFLALSVDSLGHGKFRTGTLQPSPPAAGAQQNDVKQTDAGVEYRRKGVAASTPARWTIRLGANGFTLISQLVAIRSARADRAGVQSEAQPRHAAGNVQPGRQRSSAGDSALARPGHGPNHRGRR